MPQCYIFYCHIWYSNITAIKGDHVILKESFAGLLSLLMEAAKCDSDLDGIR